MVCSKSSLLIFSLHVDILKSDLDFRSLFTYPLLTLHPRDSATASGTAFQASTRNPPKESKKVALVDSSPA